MSIYLQRTTKGTTYGTYVIDRQIKNRRLKLVTGSDDLRTVKKMDLLIDDLKHWGYDDLIQKLADRRVTIRQLYQLHIAGKLHDPSVDTEVVLPLHETLYTWMESYRGWSESTRTTMTEFVNTMFKRTEKQIPNPTLEDIPTILRAYRIFCEENDSPRVYNLVRSCLYRFVRMTVGKTSPLYMKVADVEKLPDRPKQPQTSKTPQEIERLTKVLPLKYRQMVWTMCTLGVGWKEYQSITVRDDIKTKQVVIEGTKMDKKDQRRRRQVPLIYPPHPPSGTEKHFRKVLTKHAKKVRLDNLRIYTFRKCYANWLKESGIPDWRIEMYMGHQPKTQTQKYQTTEVWRWLIEDAEVMRKWLATQREKAHVSVNNAIIANA